MGCTYSQASSADGLYEFEGSFPPLGIKCSYFKEFIDIICKGRENVEGLSTENVIKSFIMPYTENKGMSLCEVLKDSEIQGFVGTAVWSISHEWTFPFLETIDTIIHFFQEKYADTGGDPDPILWIDIFSTNLHSKNSQNGKAKCACDYWLGTKAGVGPTNVLHLMDILLHKGDSELKRITYEILATEARASKYNISMLTHGAQATLEMLKQDAGSIVPLITGVDTRYLDSALNAGSKEKSDAVRKFLRNGFHDQYDMIVSNMLQQYYTSLLSNQIFLSIGVEEESIWLFALSNFYFKLGKFELAEPFAKTSFSNRTNKLGKSHVDTLNSMHLLALINAKQGKAAVAEPMLEDCLQISKNILGEDHLKTISIMHDLAVHYTSQSKYTTAESILKFCIQIRREYHGDHHDELLESMCALALVYNLKGEYNDAEALYMICLESYRSEYGEMFPRTLVTTVALADTFFHQGVYKNAETLYSSCLENFRQVFGETHTSTVELMSNLGDTYLYLQQFQLAVPLYKIVLKERQLMLGLENFLTIQLANNLATCYDKIGKSKDAEAIRVMLQPKTVSSVGRASPHLT